MHRLYIYIETSYYSPIFKLIQARVKKEHEVLEIGCGWGSLAIEIVKRTGCKYTGITLSEEQLRYAEMKVKEAGLQVLYLTKINLHVYHYTLAYSFI